MIDLGKSKAAQAFFDSIRATQRDFHRHGSGLYASEHKLKWRRGKLEYTLRAVRLSEERGLVYAIYLDRVSVSHGVVTTYVGRTDPCAVDTVDVKLFGQRIYRFYERSGRK